MKGSESYSKTSCSTWKQNEKHPKIVNTILYHKKKSLERFESVVVYGSIWSSEWSRAWLRRSIGISVKRRPKISLNLKDKASKGKLEIHKPSLFNKLEAANTSGVVPNARCCRTSTSRNFSLLNPLDTYNILSRSSCQAVATSALHKIVSTTTCRSKSSRAAKHVKNWAVIHLTEFHYLHWTTAYASQHHFASSNSPLARHGSKPGIVATILVMFRRMLTFWTMVTHSAEKHCLGTELDQIWISSLVWNPEPLRTDLNPGSHQHVLSTQSMPMLVRAAKKQHHAQASQSRERWAIGFSCRTRSCCSWDELMGFGQSCLVCPLLGIPASC